MNLRLIIDYTIRALGNTIPVILVYLLLRAVWLIARKKRPDFRWELWMGLLVFYLTCLFQITVVRYGIQWGNLFQGNWSTIQLIPLIMTFAELKEGLWFFIYPIVGNIAWFFPMGFLLPAVTRGKLRLRYILCISLGISVGIEILQWILGSGISDIDDIIFNIFGAWCGYRAFWLSSKVLFFPD